LHYCYHRPISSCEFSRLPLWQRCIAVAFATGVAASLARRLRFITLHFSDLSDLISYSSIEDSSIAYFAGNAASTDFELAA
jgi:hypothetical protein